MNTVGEPTIGIGVIGYAFMGKAHSQGWRSARSFLRPALEPKLVALAGRDADAVADIARRFDWQDTETDWRAVIERDDVELVDICTPGDTHAEIAIAALQAGKHVLCEKPLANSVAEAEAMADAADKARAEGVRAMVGFTYRRVPALALARSMIAAGRLGEIRHVRAQYLQDWLTDPQAPLTWRLQAERAGSGALGDIGAHIIDLTQHVTGQRITGVSATTRTFVPERPLSDNGAGTGKVTVDDAVAFTARFSGGALGTFEATRFANGRKNALRIEINGSQGSLAFDLEELNVLQFYDGAAGQEAGFTRILVTEPEHPYLAGWWPPGHLLGYEHGFAHQATDMLNAIAEGVDPEPTFADGLAVQRVIGAVQESAARDCVWTSIEQATEVAR